MAHESGKAAESEEFLKRRLNLLAECSKACRKCEAHVRVNDFTTLFSSASLTLDSYLDEAETEWGLETWLDVAYQDCCDAYDKLLDFGIADFRASADMDVEGSARILGVESKSAHELAIFYLVKTLFRVSAVADGGAVDGIFAPEALLKSRSLSFPESTYSAEVTKRVCTEILSFCGRPELYRIGTGINAEFLAIRKSLIDSAPHEREPNAASDESNDAIHAEYRTEEMNKKTFAGKLGISTKTLTTRMNQGTYKFIKISRQGYIFDKRDIPLY